MKNYVKPEFNIHSFNVETSIMDATPTPTVAPMISEANINIKNTGELSKKYYAEYKNDDANWKWEEQQ